MGHNLSVGDRSYSNVPADTGAAESAEITGVGLFLKEKILFTGF